MTLPELPEPGGHFGLVNVWLTDDMHAYGRKCWFAATEAAGGACDVNDALRYRWLRRLDHFAVVEAILDTTEYSTLDAAVDAARGKKSFYDDKDWDVHGNPLFTVQQMAAERERVIEECALVCDARVMGDCNREDEEAKRCAAAIRALKEPTA